MSQVTQILQQIDQGDTEAAEKLLPLVYDELRKLAGREMSAERKDHTLQATALVHEAYMQLVDREPSRDWSGRAHFFSAAAEAMRRILIQQARRKNAAKRGGDFQRVDADLNQIASQLSDERVLELDEALRQLEQSDPEKAALVKLRYFVGLSIPEAAESLNISTATAERQWAYVRSWLQCKLQDAD